MFWTLLIVSALGAVLIKLGRKYGACRSKEGPEGEAEGGSLLGYAG